MQFSVPDAACELPGAFSMVTTIDAAVLEDVEVINAGREGSSRLQEVV
jgi:hypothetical protein